MKALAKSLKKLYLEDKTKDEKEHENIYAGENIFDSTYIDSFSTMFSKKNALTDVKEETGDDRCKRVLSEVLSYVEEWSDNQMFFIHLMMMTAASWIYGEELKYNKFNILMKNGWPKLCEFLMILAPRREGKTYCVAAFAAAMLVSIPKIKVYVYSNGKRASTAMGGVIKNFLEMSKKKRNFNYLENNQETVSIYGLTNARNQSDLRVLKLFPSKSEISFYYLCIKVIIIILIYYYQTFLFRKFFS